jgi:hypothetical protein
MAITIRRGENKTLLCKLGIHRWGRWHGISFARSNVIDVERKCHRCGQIKRKTKHKQKCSED